MSQLIERAIKADKWPQARALIRSELKRKPDSHWLLARLALTYYEQRQYKRALLYTKKALNLSPYCPLVLWEYAGCLDMLGQSEEALSMYRGIVRRGVKRLAYGECSEGIVWARCLIADCYYRIAKCYTDLGDFRQAGRSYRHHLALRSRGYSSIYPIYEVRKKLLSLL